MAINPAKKYYVYILISYQSSFFKCGGNSPEPERNTLLASFTNIFKNVSIKTFKSNFPTNCSKRVEVVPNY